jgi:hypothetical protein
MKVSIAIPGRELEWAVLEGDREGILVRPATRKLQR